MYLFFSQNRELSQLSEAKRIVGQHELQNIPVLLSSKKSHEPTVRNRPFKDGDFFVTSAVGHGQNGGFGKWIPQQNAQTIQD